MNLLENSLFKDNCEEALGELQQNGYESWGMLLATIKNSDGEIFQAHLTVTRNESDFIEDTEGIPELKVYDGELISPSS